MQKTDKKKEKTKKWRKKRHVIAKKFTFIVTYPIAKLWYKIKVERYKDRRQCLILYNHQTAWDQFFIGMAFKAPIYYLVSEDLFSNGLLSKIWRWAIGPIAIKKQTTDIHAVMDCMKVAKEGGTIAISPEGNRTYSGTTEYMSPAIIKLAKKLKLPIAFFRIEGGYGVQPRWSDVVRKGKMRAYVSKVVEPEEYASLSDEEFFAMTQRELYVNESNPDATFEHKKLAEYLERAVYVCPDCGIAKFYSEGDRIRCTSCEKQIEYLPTKQLRGVGFDFPFKNVKEWYDYQCDYINGLEIANYVSVPLFQDRVRLYEVILYKRKNLLSEDTELAAYGERFVFNEREFDFQDVKAVSVLGRNKLNIYHKDEVYQVKGDKRFNALKYVHIFYRWKNVKEGKNGKFLGL